MRCLDENMENIAEYVQELGNIWDRTTKNGWVKISPLRWFNGIRWTFSQTLIGQWTRLAPIEETLEQTIRNFHMSFHRVPATHMHTYRSHMYAHCTRMCRLKVKIWFLFSASITLTFFTTLTGMGYHSRESVQSACNVSYSCNSCWHDRLASGSQVHAFSG